MKKFGKNIRLIRKSLKLNQSEFAEPLEISGKYVSDLERDVAIPSDRILGLIEIKYRINRKWLKTGLGEKYIKREAMAHESHEPYKRHGGYTGHTTDDLTGDEKMSTAVSSLIKIYDSEDTKMIRLINRLLREFCAALADDTAKTKGEK